MNIRSHLPSPFVASIILGIIAVLSFLGMLILLKYGHSAVSPAAGTVAPTDRLATVGALGILSGLAAFFLGLVALACAVLCVLFLRKRDAS